MITKNTKNNKWLDESPLFKAKEQKYYYDFGTGNKIERHEVKEERDAILKAANEAINKTTSRKKDDFLEGFNDPYGEKRAQEPKQKAPDRNETFGKISAKADNGSKSSQRNIDPFLDGFNQRSTEESKWMRTVNTISRASRAYEDFLDKISPYVQKASLFSSTAPISFAADLAIAPLKEAHYSRNDKNAHVPQTINEAKSWGWHIEDQDYCHQFTAPDRKNVKYVSADGSGEQIFDSKGNVVTADEDEATFNFFHPGKQKLLHTLSDFAPWVLWGNSPDDSTTMLERIVTPLVLKYYEENVLNRSGNNSGISDR